MVRTKEIEKLSHGGNRDKGVYLDSIAVNPDVPVADEIVLVVDDVTTSGKLLYACRDILLAHGAKRVALLALGCDAIVLKAVLDCGGRAVAVMPCGLDEIYPKTNRGLAEELLEKGGCLLIA